MTNDVEGSKLKKREAQVHLNRATRTKVMSFCLGGCDFINIRFAYYKLTI